MSGRDHFGSVMARIGIIRNNYKVNPGLYCVGNPTADSPVLVTANYKLSLDNLREQMGQLDAWILVVDTRGINVWCAAGKKTFSTDEVALQVKRAHLVDIVSHRELILPQLAASGVALNKLRKQCGFAGVFGPIRAIDISEFLQSGKKGDETMRMVTFSISERLVLVPVEIFLILKPFLIVVAGIFLISGIGTDYFTLQMAWQRGLVASGATVGGVLAGAMLVPLLLPVIPGRQFWLKGVQVGAVVGFVYLYLFMGRLELLEIVTLWLWMVVAASFTGMNFTGATPYTSLSGVEYEMRRGLALQIGGAVLAFVLWVVVPFTG